MKRFAQTAAAATVIILALTGCGVTAKNAQPSASSASSSVNAETPSAAPSEAEATPTSGTVSAALETLTVSPEASSDSYNRDAFKHWVSENSSGCDTRFAVLEMESVIPVSSSGCSINSGEWVSSYDGVKVTNAKDLDIDHMVPLAEAWRSGASQWDAATRQAYANDLGYENSLIAVTASSNRSKSDKDPAKWLPDTDACVYVNHWVMVKYRWNLSVDTTEKDKILQVLSFCDDQSAVYPDKATSQTSTQAVTEAPVPAPAPVQPTEPDTAGADPKFGSCSEATSNGYGPYTKDVDEEYAWYRDGDKDGVVCE